uniref:Uncharacterized protein n=1 Tax=Ascaris lumbricoides TaxID=6252 RepID=A0A0M3I1Z3_ASCLU
MARDDDDECPSFLWYFVASFGYTILILLILVAYLTMYSSHFMWALSKKKEPGTKTGTDSRGSKESSENKDSKNEKGSKESKEEKGNKESKED